MSKWLELLIELGGDYETKGWFSADYSPDGIEFRVNKNEPNIKPEKVVFESSSRINTK